MGHVGFKLWLDQNILISCMIYETEIHFTCYLALIKSPFCVSHAYLLSIPLEKSPNTFHCLQWNRSCSPSENVEKFAVLPSCLTAENNDSEITYGKGEQPIYSLNSTGPVNFRPSNPWLGLIIRPTIFCFS